MPENQTWDQEDRWWQKNYSNQPYATGRTYEELRPAFRYGYESGQHHMGRTWKDVQSDLRTGWDKFEGKRAGGAAWEDIKDAVRAAWHRVTGQDDLDADKMSESEVNRLSHRERPR